MSINREPVELGLGRELAAPPRTAPTTAERASARPNEESWMARRAALGAPSEHPLPPPTAPEPLRGQPRKLRARSPAVRDLTVEVDVRHLVGGDVVVIAKRDWLPDDAFFDLAAEREEH